MMKYLKYIIGIIVILILVFIYMSTHKKQESPKTPDNVVITEALNDTIGIKPGQKLSDYIVTRKKVLKSFSQVHPDDTLIGMISLSNWMTVDQLDDTLKQYKISPLAVEISFRSEGLGDSEIRLQGRTLRDAFREAMEERLSRKDINNPPTHGQGGSAEMQEAVRKKIKKQREQEANAIASGKPLIYGVLVTGRAADFEKISNDKRIRLIDAIYVQSGELKDASLETKTKLKAYKPEYNG